MGRTRSACVRWITIDGRACTNTGWVCEMPRKWKAGDKIELVLDTLLCLGKQGKSDMSVWLPVSRH